MQTEHRMWWTRPGLEVREGRLSIAGRDAEKIARDHGTPLYTHDLVSVREQAERLRDAMAAAGLRHRIRFALKAQRDADFLRFLRAEAPFVGMDVCSPGETTWALEHGWTSAEISYTGTNVSERDLDDLLPTGVHVNVDLLSQLERLGRRAPGSTVGIRVNPGIGASYLGGKETLYAGTAPTKFGILPERLADAVAIARRHHLTIDTVHYHSGYLYMTESIPIVQEAARRVAAMVRELRALGCPIAEVNTGGGLGVRFRGTDGGLDVNAWAQALARSLGDLEVAVATEPGEYLAKHLATLLAEVVTVEDRGHGQVFVGLDAGWNTVNESFVYTIPFHPIVCRAADSVPARRYTVTGHINEGNDIFATEVELPEVHEGDVVAIPNVGSYNLSMASNHCMRPPAPVVSFTDRLVAAER
ncbi:MAG: diaminopimelate decarboxylase [Actinomycetota bacterium]